MYLFNKRRLYRKDIQEFLGSDGTESRGSALSLRRRLHRVVPRVITVGTKPFAPKTTEKNSKRRGHRKERS